MASTLSPAFPQAAEPLVSVEEYLRSVYHPDCEYIDGQIKERNLGEYDHGYLQTLLAALFTNHRETWGVRAVTEVRTQVTPTHFRIPDVTVLRADSPKGRIISHPPLIAIEILSRGDRMEEIQEKITDYLAFGIENIWILDPERRTAQIATSAGLNTVDTGELTVPNTPVRVVLKDLFAELD